ncbi:MULTISPECIES: hypothetical protein [unclassified Pseudomonas]|uniref:hypothetical protein n=1 Tax=unclassified Pseudomonas TaxID=196821 RepID=UPI0011AEC3B0|nr:MULTISPECIES: hypothetical protein [unclassified Pseudomonas]
MKSGAEELPKIESPSLQVRIEAALMTLACQGDPGLRTKLSLMHPSQDIDKQSCLKFATIVLSRTIAASLRALPPPAIETISKELTEYLFSEFECP